MTEEWESNVFFFFQIDIPRGIAGLIPIRESCNAQNKLLISYIVSGILFNRACGCREFDGE